MKSPDAPLSLALHVAPSQEPGYICMGYAWQYEDRVVDCLPAVWPLPAARQVRMLMAGFLADVAGPHCTHAFWELGDVALYHSKMSGYLLRLQKVGCGIPDVEEFLGPLEDCIAEIDAHPPWPVEPIDWLAEMQQKYQQN